MLARPLPLLAALTAVAFAAPLTAGHAAPSTQDRFAPDPDNPWIAFARTPFGQIRLMVTLNGVAARAIVDTGLSHTIITPALAARAGVKALRHEGERRGIAIGGDVPIVWAAAERLTVGGLTRTGGTIGITPAAADARLATDMLLGADVLSAAAIEIDFDTARLRLMPSGRRPFAGTSITIRRAGERWLTEARVANRRVRPVLIDTGDGGALTLTERAWAAAGLAPAPTTTIGWGLGGEQTSGLAVAHVRLGDLPAAEAEIRVDPPSPFWARTGAAGRIGTALLDRYHVLIDAQAGRLVLAPRKRAAAPVPRSTSGLIMASEAGALRIVHVMRGSPAAQSGLRAGERICGIDGTAPDRATLPRWTAGAPGTLVRLTSCAGRDVVLTLARFY